MPPPATTKVLTYEEQERVLCFHGPMLYEAKVLSIQKPENKGDNPLYKVHYKGWKNTWDEFVPADRLRKMNEENLKAQRDLIEQSKPPKKSASNLSRKSLGGAGSSTGGKAGSEDPPTTAPRAGPKRGRELEIEKEEDYLKRHDVKIFIPDTIKAVLVDDWENVTKNQQLVPLPKDMNVVSILDAYRKAVPKKKPGSAEADIFDEVIAGLKLYFDKSLGTILLYRFERQQFLDVTKEHPGKQPSEIYGAEHMLRLCVSMPELLAHTNMDAQAMSKLRDHIEEFVRFLAKHPEYIANPYESGEAYRRVYALNQETGEMEWHGTPYPGLRSKGKAKQKISPVFKSKGGVKLKETVQQEEKDGSESPLSDTATPPPVDDTPPAAETPTPKTASKRRGLVKKDASALEVEKVPAPRRRGPASKAKDTPAPEPTPAPAPTPAPKKRMGRPPKNPLPDSPAPEPVAAEETEEPAPKKRMGRPRKHPLPDTTAAKKAGEQATTAEEHEEPAPKRMARPCKPPLPNITLPESAKEIEKPAPVPKRKAAINGDDAPVSAAKKPKADGPPPRPRAGKKPIASNEKESEEPTAKNKAAGGDDAPAPVATKLKLKSQLHPYTQAGENKPTVLSNEKEFGEPAAKLKATAVVEGEDDAPAPAPAAKKPKMNAPHSKVQAGKKPVALKDPNDSGELATKRVGRPRKTFLPGTTVLEATKEPEEPVTTRRKADEENDTPAPAAKKQKVEAGKKVPAPKKMVAVPAAPAWTERRSRKATRAATSTPDPEGTSDMASRCESGIDAERGVSSEL